MKKGLGCKNYGEELSVLSQKKHANRMFKSSKYICCLILGQHRDVKPCRLILKTEKGNEKVV